MVEQSTAKTDMVEQKARAPLQACNYCNHKNNKQLYRGGYISLGVALFLKQ